MKQIFHVLLSCITLITSSLVIAENAPYVDLRKTTFRAVVTEVISPTSVKLVTERRGYKEELILTLADIKPGNNAIGLCKKASNPHHHHKSIGPKSAKAPEKTPELKHACKVLRETIDGKNVGVQITQWEHPTHGYLSLGETVINYELISTGEYRVDYDQSRSAHLVKLEKKARCDRVGSWEEMLGNKIEEMKCQD